MFKSFEHLMKLDILNDYVLKLSKRDKVGRHKTGGPVLPPAHFSCTLIVCFCLS